LAKEKAKALLEGAAAAALEDPGGDCPLAPDVWLKFSILSLDSHGKIYQWKATAKGEGLGVVPALSPLHESKDKEVAPAVEAEAEAPAEAPVAAATMDSADDGTRKKGRKKQRVS